MPTSLAPFLCAGLAVAAAPPSGGSGFQVPPKPILDLVDVELPPQAQVDARGRTVMLLGRQPFLRLEDLAQPELRLAGLRLNPANHNAARTKPYTSLAFQDVATGRALPLHGLPCPLRLEHASFSPDGRRAAFVQVLPEGLALWVVELASGQAKRLTEPVLSAVMGRPYHWMPDGEGLLVRVRPALAPYREASSLPGGPAVQEARGVKSPGRTLQDLLRNPADEARFSFYATHAVQRVDLEGHRSPVLAPGLYRSVLPSPDGRFLLVEELRRPFSYQFALNRFPSRVFVADAQGREVARLADKPLRDRIPLDKDAVEEGRRGFDWRDDRPCTVSFVQALDGGDPRREAPFRDALYQLDAPFTTDPVRLAQVKGRVEAVQWGGERLALVRDGWRKTGRVRTTRVDPGAPGAETPVLFDRSEEDAYGNPGHFVTRPDARNRSVLAVGRDGRTLWLAGEGCSPEGKRPFLDAYDLAGGKSRRLWQADGRATHEAIVRVLDPEKGRLLTRIEGPRLYPNLHVRDLGRRGGLRALTAFPNPYKALEGVRKETIRYTRPDGVALSASLILPPGYDRAKDGPLPVLMEAYPVEFKDAEAAGQLRESPHAFVRPSWGSPVFWALRGYAVLEDAQFPIVGKGGAEPNDTYVEQLVANAKAAIDEVARRGVGDPRRVACVGHSYGAFMVANLLANSDLFAAGIARSGAYNRTLTPFGFQHEQRSYWEAREVYTRMSPFTFADRIKAPILFIHGDADSNPGTFTLQSERLFQAVKGLGGRARLVLLPLESHSYAARENILHMLWEEDAWLETWVKARK